MQRSDFTALTSKHAIPIGDGGYAFVPPPLPPDWVPNQEMMLLLSSADIAVGRLAGLGQTLANPHLLIRPFVRREAVLSSKIEGTQSEYEDAVLFEVEPSKAKSPDADEVNNYILALDYGLAHIKKLPLSRRLLCAIHKQLLASGRGLNRSPGQFRKNQVWIGPQGMGIKDATYVPPPVPEMTRAFNQLERFLNQDPTLPILIRLALVHYQIEAIHPFEDGNGRIGRLLIILMLCNEGVLPQPLLYLSAYFEQNRQQYYRLLLETSTQGRWDAWISFFLKGVISQADDAIARASKLSQLREQYHQALHASDTPARVHQMVDQLFERPATMATQVASELDVTHKSAMKYLRILCVHGIIEEITGKTRDKVFVAHRIIHVTQAPIESL